MQHVRTGRIAHWSATLLGLGVAFLLVRVALARAVLLPELAAMDTTLGTVLVIAQFAIAACLALGLFVRFASIALLVLVGFAVSLAHTIPPDLWWFVGAASFLATWGRGPLSLGALFSSIFYAMDTASLRRAGTQILVWTSALALVTSAARAVWLGGEVTRAFGERFLGGHALSSGIAAAIIFSILAILLVVSLTRRAAAFLALLLFLVSAYRFNTWFDITVILPMLCLMTVLIVGGGNEDEKLRGF